MLLKVRVGGPARRGRRAGSGRGLRAPGGRFRLGALLLRSGRRLEEDPCAARFASGVTLRALLGILRVRASKHVLAEPRVVRRESGSRRGAGVLDRVGKDGRRRSGTGLRACLRLVLGRVEGQREREHPGAEQRRQERGDGSCAQRAAPRAPDAQTRVVGRELGRVRVERGVARRGLGSGGRHWPFPVCTGRGASPVERVMRTISWSFCPTRSSAASISRSMTYVSFLTR